ncbi:MAG: hypothetical protein ACI9MC_003188 [Kiritimatiellia bacterium]|jgi:hypothetical protein
MQSVKSVLVALPLVLGVAHAAEVELSPSDDIRSLTQALGAGSIYNFNDGVYEIDNELLWTGEGTESEPIIMRATPGASPVIRLVGTGGGGRVLRIDKAKFMRVSGLTFEVDDGRYEDLRDVGLQLSASSDVSVEDCTFRHLGGTGIYLPGDNSGVTITGTEVVDTRDGSGMWVGCGDASCWTQASEFSNNLIHDLKGSGGEAMYFSPGTQGVQIVDNVITNIRGRNGITVLSTEFGEQNIVERNVIWDVANVGIVASGAAIIRNNVVFDVDVHALYSNNNRESLENLVISFNTFANTGSSTVRVDNWAGSAGMVFANNAVANPVGEAFRADQGDLDEGHFFSTNLVTGQVAGLAELYPEGFAPAGGYYDFLDVEVFDYYPSSGSSLRNAGDPSSATWVPEVDFNGFDRNGAEPTVGAYEWVTKNNPGWLIAEEFKTEVDNSIDPTANTGGCCGDDKTPSEALVLMFPLLGLGLLRRRRR